LSGLREDVAVLPSPSSTRNTHWLKVAVSLLLSAVLFWLAVRQVDFGRLAGVLRDANYVYVVLAIGVYFIDLAVRAARWQILLGSVGSISARRLYPVLAIGYMANNLLPGRVGELSRAFLVGRRENVSATSVLATIAIERVVDGLTILALLFFTLLILPSTLPDAGWLSTIANAAALTFGVGMVGIVILLVWRRAWVRLAGRILSRLPSHVGDRLTVLLDRFIFGFGVLREPWHVVLTLGLSILVWVVGAGAYFLVAAGFGVQITLVGAIATICVVNLATAVPQAPAGLGAFEAVAEQLFMLLGVATTTAFGITIVIHAVLFLPVVVVGLFSLWRMNLPLFERPTPRSGLAVSAEPAP
jgi:uncharacterized protein (TIRG00374 family)